MDKLSGLANKLGGNKGQEYLDKGELQCLNSGALDFNLTTTGINAAEQKFGGGQGGSDPAKKVTDAGREQMDKVGKGVPDKFSQ
ncbi:hypothetical protein N7519_011814 [Penicillium mononematosum]|uniref:uncharacterized protein n=1 Tax=Penicillium mononematosum TaxID=268346 RepID=UPI00254949AF|nr:uncharacterized protein N7519_011814 [Penicillium mononematosum]KAJ6181353.1 hypothetical protein N7519_011814 [Penicillium mononematosum]